MAVPRSIRRFRIRECRLRQDQLRRDQARRDQDRKSQLHKMLRRRKWIDGIEGALVLTVIIALFVVVYWLALSDMLPAAY